MKEVIRERHSPSDTSLDECCRIAESMMQEIQIIGLMESRLDEPTPSSRQKGSLIRSLFNI